MKYSYRLYNHHNDPCHIITLQEMLTDSISIENIYEIRKDGSIVELPWNYMWHEIQSGEINLKNPEDIIYKFSYLFV